MKQAQIRDDLQQAYLETIVLAQLLDEGFIGPANLLLRVFGACKVPHKNAWSGTFGNSQLFQFGTNGRALRLTFTTTITEASLILDWTSDYQATEQDVDLWSQRVELGYVRSRGKWFFETNLSADGFGEWFGRHGSRLPIPDWHHDDPMPWLAINAVTRGFLPKRPERFARAMVMIFLEGNQTADRYQADPLTVSEATVLKSIAHAVMNGNRWMVVRTRAGRRLDSQDARDALDVIMGIKPPLECSRDLLEFVKMICGAAGDASFGGRIV